MISRIPVHLILCLVGLALAGCGKTDSTTTGSPGANDKPLTIGVAFETLQTGFWVAAMDAFKAEAVRRNIKVVPAIANGDSTRQQEQVRSLITRKVDGIVLVPKDSKTCLPMIKAANSAHIPIVLFNRPPDKSDAKSVSVVADNFSLTRDTVAYMVGEARKTGRKHKAMILIGDLGDVNAIGRRDGFDAAIQAASDAIEVVARVPTEWNQEKAQSGVVNALQASPEISFIFSSSDFLFPSVISALKAAGRYKKIGEPGHVILGGFDGDPLAYRMLQEGYLDATGVQDVYFEVSACMQALLDLRRGKAVTESIPDPGFVIHQGNLKEKSARMWGANTKN